MRWVDPPGEARGFGLMAKQVWEALVSERVRVGELVETLKKLRDASADYMNSVDPEDITQPEAISERLNDALQEADAELFKASTPEEIRELIQQVNTHPQTQETAYDGDFWMAEVAAQLAEHNEHLFDVANELSELNENLSALGDLLTGTGIVDKVREMVSGKDTEVRA